ncbi:unnamed protein product [Rhizopus stolonifer]
MLSFLLKQQPDTFSIWNNIVNQVERELDRVDIQHGGHWYLTTANIPSYMIQFKFKLFPYDIPSKVQLLIIVYTTTYYLVSIAFGRLNLVKSGYTFGLAAMFLSIACFTTALGITDKLGTTLNNVPWTLLLLVVNIACLENIFLLTNAVLNAGCDMIVKEKISRGLQSVGLPMTTTLIAELVIITVGTAMDIVIIKEFCLFVKIALVVDYILEMTFVIAVLSIDIKRVEATDLDDRQISKRLHEIGNRDTEVNQPPDLCPIQDTANENESKSCAECKDFKTHRVFNALILCFIVLGLSFFIKKDKSFHHKRIATHHTNTTKSYIPNYQSDIYQLSQQFWSIVNPEKESVWIQVDPPLLFIYDYTTQVESYVNKVQAYYDKKSLTIQYKPEAISSPFRLLIYSVVQRIVILFLGINIPALILWVCLIAIITWMTPKWRDQWLLPLLVRTFNKSVLAILGFIWSIRDFYKAYIKGIRSRYEYDADGLHRGAIMTQAIFNKEHSHIKGIHVQTLSHQHVADIQTMDVNNKGSLASCGQDGRLVLWDTTKAVWMARLDKLCSQGRLAERGTINPDYHKTTKRSKRPIQSSLDKHLPKPLCMKVDQGNKWIATSHEDQTIRIWRLSDSMLINTLSVQHLSSQPPTIRHRFNGVESERQHQRNDRILDIHFINVAEDLYISKHLDTSQNALMSLHRSGLVREWNVLTGECVQTIETGHTRSVTQFYVDSHHMMVSSWMFTTSRDGTVKCWERRSQEWNLMYTIEQYSPITSIATKVPVNGMGVLVSGSADGTVKVWDFETGEAVCTLSDGKNELVKHRDTGGPIRHFSNFNDVFSDIASDTDSISSHSTEGKSNHRGAIQQLVVTRYCEVESGLCLCGGYNTCFGNGFLVASSGSDHKVHAWRLEHKGTSGPEGSCTLLPRDYHRRQYKRYKLDEGTEPTKRLRSPSIPKKIIGRYSSKSSGSDIPGIVDIEQIADRAPITLSPVFLGKIDQPAGHGLVFCDKVLAGVRRIKTQRIEWEAWFAPLQYCEPATMESLKIPVETFSLDQSEETVPNKPSSFLSLFRSTVVTHTAAGSVAGPSHAPKYRRIPSLDDEEAIEDEEAGENLPFSTIRHVVALDGCGLACDYGNFIKLVYIDNKASLTEKEMTRQAQILEEEKEQRVDEDCDCPPERRGKDGCCGANKNIRCKVKKAPVKYNECSLRHKCSRAADCAVAASL